MTNDPWLDLTRRDAERRNLPALRPLLEGLAQATQTLRQADWNVDARQGTEAPSPRDAR